MKERIEAGCTPIKRERLARLARLVNMLYANDLPNVIGWHEAGMRLARQKIPKPTLHKTPKMDNVDNVDNMENGRAIGGKKVRQESETTP